ncbi:hypothetical protein BU16DRAFT_527895 [Lophium mytilinum]|uniref:F-box domain-containing protein n=1 Tax=Lophium mytilinum TaxID=390894 RepID=A0A6A6QVP9_9PEZI|nr:hypothetical protein BU16DRAFT_527895 [Lophium mytilinum]
MVSRKFRRISKPHIYHNVHKVGGISGDKLIRKLCDNPDLAKTVKVFSLDSPVSRKVSSYQRQVMRRRSDFQSDPPGASFVSDNAALAFLLHTVPALEVLDLREFTMDSSRAIRHCRRQDSENWLSALRNHNLLNLREIRIGLRGLRLSELALLFQIPTVRILDLFNHDELKASRILHRLKDSRLNDGLFPAGTSSVESISVQDLGDWDSDEIIRGCKSLNYFGIHYRDHRSQPFNFLEAYLDSQKAVLEKLDISASDDWHLTRIQQCMRGILPMSGLNTFTSLLDLRVDYTALAGLVLPGEDSIITPPLWQNLPPNIRWLRIDLTVLEPTNSLASLHLDLMELAEACAVALPYLKTVVVATDLFDPSDALEEAKIPFAKASVWFQQICEHHR